MYEIKTVPNQRVITVSKAVVDKEHLYTCINLQALSFACKTLKSKAGIKLYLYLAKNQDKYTFALSSADFMQFAGVKRDAYNTAFKELEDNCYLIPIGTNRYTFNEAGMSNTSVDNPDSKPTVTVIDKSQFKF